MIKNEFKDKKILFFAPSFFNYEIEIKNKLINLGAKVDFYDERMEPTNLEKVIIRLKKDLLLKKIKNYYHKIIEENKNKKYDYILFLSPETITRELVIELKESQKQAKLILYMQDSIKNKKNVSEILYEFDVCFTFDKEDSKKYPDFKFLSLFYLDEYKNFSQKNKEIKYDLSFIGTIHSDRYRIIKKIEQLLAEKELVLKSYMYFPSKLMYLFMRIFNKNYRYSKIKEFSFSSISKEEILDILLSSKVILDIQHPNQSGLTMRTIEMIGLKKKIITTNANIKEYDFYNPNNILIIDRKNIKIDYEFFQKEYIELDEKMYEKYSLENWLKVIFE